MPPRFDEVARLKDLEKKATPGPWCFVDDNIKTVEEIDIDGEGDRIVYIPYDSNDSGMICVARDTIPWLLEVAGCFQPGDGNLMGELISVMDAYFGEYYRPHKAAMHHLLQAAKIMEERE